jgi:hypothetical protein
VINLFAGGIEASAELSKMIIQEPPAALKAMADLDFINGQTFKLIQTIQQAATKGDRVAAYENLKVIDGTLDAKMVEFMKIKDKDLKKDLQAKLQECKTRTSKVIAMLRQIQDLTHIPNDLIARMNDEAYKAIKQGGFQKMLDKRALQNENTYADNEKQIKDIVGKLKMEELEKKYKDIIEDIGECFMSCMTTTEAIEMGDCMCLGLNIERPEEAIADPSRLIIKDIIPNYISLDTFLESAKFKMQGLDTHEEKAKAVTGGFNNQKSDKVISNNDFDDISDNEQEPQVMFGLGREAITGLLPLYLFKEHWMVAKRKLGPLFGFMCTLDVMGFSNE